MIDSGSYCTFMQMYRHFILAILIRHFFTALLIGLPACLFAQEKLKGKIQGLPSGNIYFVSQDSSGFLWIGSDKGLSRFDGHTLRHFTIGDELTDNDIFSMFCDRQGRYWFLTNGGTPTVLDHGLFLNTRNTNWLSGIRPGKPGLHITQSKDGAIWYTTYDTIYQIKPGVTMERFPNPMRGKKHEGFQAVVEYRDTIYFVTNRGVINHRSGQSHAFGADSLIVLNFYTKINPVADGFYYISNNKLLFYSFIKQHSIQVGAVGEGEQLLSFLGNHTNYLQFSTNRYVYRYDLSRRSIDRIKESYPSYVTSILVDKFGNRWISSMKEGVVFDLSCSVGIESTAFLPQLQKCNNISVVPSGVYFCYDEGQWARMEDRKTVKFTLGRNPYHLPVRKIREDDRGGQYIITYGDLYYKRGDIEKVLLQSVKDVITTHSGTYFATSAGLLKLPASVDVLSNPVFQFLPLQLIDAARLYHLEKGNGDTLFAGSPEGLTLFVKDKKIPLPWSDPILNRNITSIHRMRNGLVAFSSADEGIGLIGQNRLQVYSKKNGLLSNSCNAIIEGGQSDLWVACSGGIMRLVQTGDSYKAMNVPAFYQVKGKNINDLYQAGDSLFVATDNGSFYYQLSQLSQCNILPDVAIHSFIVNDLEQAISPSYELAADQHNIRIAYAGISFNDKGELYYRYRLKKDDSSWIYSNAREVMYPFLPDGQYQFQVQSSFDQETWSAPGMISFIIRKPVWKQGWFIFCGIILGIAILILVFRFVITAQKRRMQVSQLQLKVSLEQASYQRQLAQLQQTALAMQLNPHFIFNALNSIKGLYAEGNSAEARQFISAFASLMRSMLQIGRFNFHSLADEIAFTKQYLEFYRQRSSTPFQFDISLADDIDPYSIFLPVLLLQPVMENAILHGIEPSHKEGSIQTSILRSGNLLQVDISDNGVGIHFKSKYPGEQKEGRGLSLVKERIALLSENKEPTGVFISDLTDEYGQSAGTLVRLVIPIINKELYDTMHISGR